MTSACHILEGMNELLCPAGLLFISPYVSSLSFFLLWLLWIVLQTLPSAVTSALQSRWVPMVAKQNVRPTGRQTQPLTPTDRHTHVHTHSLSHTLTHTHAHTHTLSLTLPPPTLLPHSAFSFAPSCICQTLNTAIWSVISAKERLCPPDGLLRRMYTIFKVMSPVLACGLMGCSSQPGFQDLCVDFKVCCSPSSLFFFFFFFLLLRAPTFLLTHCTHTRARTAQDFVEQGTKDWFQFDANKHHSATDLAEEMKALWYRKGDEAKVIVARHS